MSTYPGGKNGSGVYQKIISLMPPHKVFVEAFAGGAAILRMKKPAPGGNVAIDIDTQAIENLADQRTGALLINCDAIEWLKRSDIVSRPDTLLYLDPPYLLETRSSKRSIYRHEMLTEDEHSALLTVLLDLPCMVMISGYHSNLYSTMLANWRTVTFTAQSRGGKKTEWVWCNFPEPLELHDYRYLGNDYRERERIKKKQTRWKDRLANMTAHERYALLSVLEDLRSPGNTVTNGGTAGTTTIPSGAS